MHYKQELKVRLESHTLPSDASLSQPSHFSTICVSLMPLLHHPFASTQYARWSRSTDTLTRLLGHNREGESVPPVPALPQVFQVPKPDVATVPPLVERPLAAPPPRVDVHVPMRSSKSSPGHFVKHSSSVTVLLSGQEHCRKGPEYNNGGVVDGIVAVPRPSGLLSLSIMVSYIFHRPMFSS
jgi:hypothetical protein